jgi:hypothetical protein
VAAGKPIWQFFKFAAPYEAGNCKMKNSERAFPKAGGLDKSG